MRRDDDDRTVSFKDALCVKETEKAILVQGEDFPDCEMWIPKSVLSDDTEVWKPGDQGTLVILEWFARKEGLA